MKTSADILNISIAVAVIAVAFFLCWLLVYLIISFKRIYKITAQAQKIANKTENLLNLIKSKIKQGGSYFVLLSKLIDRAMTYFSEKAKKRTSRKSCDIEDVLSDWDDEEEDDEDKEENLAPAKKTRKKKGTKKK